MCGRDTFSIVGAIVQVALVIAFAICVDYNDSSTSDSPARDFYGFFQDVHVMIFIGFGFLMTFLKKYSYGSVGYNMFISALVIQWATLINAWFHNAFSDHKLSSDIKVDLTTLITSDFAAGAVLITFGAVLGKVSRLQLLVIGLLEVIFYAINENIVAQHIKVTDVGGSMLVHMFGAYFGLAVARVIFQEKHNDNDDEGAVYHSDVFAMIGTIFLWMFWPSFNAGLLGPGNQQQRAIVNTYYSLAACCMTTFIISPLVNKDRKLDMVHVQNATLAGGVAVGTCADLVILPWGAMVIGIVAGIISTLGYAYVTPFLSSKLHIHDTCGVHNLHGMPALLAGIAGAIAAAAASLDRYHFELYSIWSEMKPKEGTPAWNEAVYYLRNTTKGLATSTFHQAAVQLNATIGGPGTGRSAVDQGGHQFGAVCCTLAISIIGGALTGLIVKFLDAPTGVAIYNDEPFWEVGDGYSSDTGAVSVSEVVINEKAKAEECV